MSNLTLDRSAYIANLMMAYCNNDLTKYLDILKRCEAWMDPQYYAYFYNLSKSSVFTRKGYYKI